jgi:hypothetical protein
MKIVNLTIPAHQAILVEEINRAKKILSEISDMPKLDSNKIAKWLTDNEELIGSFTHNGQPYSNFIKFIKSGRASQYYLKTLIDALDHVEGVAIDDADFYVGQQKPMSPFKDKFNINPYTTSAGRPTDRWTGD